MTAKKTSKKPTVSEGADREPRTRAERVVRDVLEATLEELGRCGFAALSVEEVAKRAGVNKTTVYRRWPTKSALVQASFERLNEDVPFPDTGSLRGDLCAFLHAKLRVAQTPRGRALMRGLSAEALAPDLVAISRRMRVGEMANYRKMLSRARARGELRTGVADELVIGAIEGAITVRFLGEGKLVTKAQATAIIDLVLRGALASRSG
ncbi:MAG: TetR/AcrR family transcriptional regulator [Polyangiaceae bacterium]|nr:TetR/AcrR family transcriptional regulator [Polyangiaceae bacterium]